MHMRTHVRAYACAYALASGAHTVCVRMRTHVRLHNTHSLHCVLVTQTVRTHNTHVRLRTHMPTQVLTHA